MSTRRSVGATILAVAGGVLVGVAGALSLGAPSSGVSSREGTAAADTARRERAATRARPPVTSTRPRGGRERPAILTPGTPDYDPLTAARVFGLDEFEIIEAEERDPAFADRRERFLREELGGIIAQLAPTLVIEAIDCRSGSCLVRGRAPVGDRQRAETVMQWMPWCSSATYRSDVTPDGDVVVEIAALCRREHVDHDEFEKLGRFERYVFEKALPQFLEKLAEREAADQ